MIEFSPLTLYSATNLKGLGLMIQLVPQSEHTLSLIKKNQSANVV